jgi:hypothetical protein
MSQYIFLKWSPSVSEQFYEKTKLEDKHKVIGSDVMETILQEGNEFIQSETKREKQFEKMHDREMVVQCNLNPFLSSNYLEDLQVQETFLTPQNSNLDNK